MSLRVLELIPTLKRAGAEQVAVSLACGLPAHGWQTRVVSMYDPFPGGFEPVLEAAGVPVVHLGKRRGLDLRMIPRLRAAIRDFAPHVLHSHSYLLRYLLPANAGLSGSRIVHTVHNLAEREVDTVGRWIHHAAFHHWVTPVAVGESVARSVESAYRLPAVITIPNGIALSRFRQPAVAAAWRAAHGFAPELPLAVAVARLEPQKNPLGLLDAFAAALPGDSPWQLLLVGEGSLREAVEQRIREMGLASRVHLLGALPDVAPVLAAAELFVLASHWEGSPLAVMEALAAGLPIVATAVGSLPELVRHGTEGLLVPPGDAASLTGALRELMGDSPRRAQMRQAALLRASAFSEEAMVAAYARLFQSVAEESR